LTLTYGRYSEDHQLQKPRIKSNLLHIYENIDSIDMDFSYDQRAPIAEYSETLFCRTRLNLDTVYIDYGFCRSHNNAASQNVL
jgi:hypothetical protein